MGFLGRSKTSMLIYWWPYCGGFPSNARHLKIQLEEHELVDDDLREGVEEEKN